MPSATAPIAPEKYEHLELKIADGIATLTLRVREQGGLRPEDYTLKKNSYDLGVYRELNDVVERLRFEHPEVRAVVIQSGIPGIFSAGANIDMLHTSPHWWKIEFCRLCNETLCRMENDPERDYIAKIDGSAVGGGYELVLACDRSYLVDDKKSSVALPEVGLLAVLPGTGGITRLEERVRPDIAHEFMSRTDGYRAKEAVKLGFVTDSFPRSEFDAKVDAIAREVAQGGWKDRQGIRLDAVDESDLRHMKLEVSLEGRSAVLTLLPPPSYDFPADPRGAGAKWYELRFWRELQQVLHLLRVKYAEVGVVVVTGQGNEPAANAVDAKLLAGAKSDWFLREVLNTRIDALKMLENTPKTFLASFGQGRLHGSLLELALACDRFYVSTATRLELGPLSHGALPMMVGESRLAHRRVATPPTGAIDGRAAFDAGLVTGCFEAPDYAEEFEIVFNRTLSTSPDAMAMLKLNVKLAGPQTTESRIFSILSPTQNWVFAGPNAHVALKNWGNVHDFAPVRT
jgi:benzoyl-CoA-dihydrodiol lyase